MKRLCCIPAIAASLTLLAVAPASAATGLAPARGFVPREVVVKFERERAPRTLALPRGAGVRETARALGGNARVEYAAPNYIATASALAPPSPFVIPNDPGSIDSPAEAASALGDWTLKQWNFMPWDASTSPRVPVSPGGIDAIGAWQNLAAAGRPGAEGVTVAVLDTGIAYRALGANFLLSPDFGPGQFVKGYDFVDKDRLPLDENGHGTHVAGTIAEKTDNAVGLTGLAYGARLMPIRVLDDHGRGDATAIAKGVRFAVAHRAQVINMSFNFGCGKKVPGVDEALREAYAQGIVVVASAGNLGAETCVSPPATGPRVIAVGGSTEGGCLGSYSLAGSALDLLAPGGGVPAPGCASVSARPIYQVTLKPGTTNIFGIPSNYVGTSMAAAHVSGAAAMVLSSGVLGPQHNSTKARVAAVTRRLRKTARSLGLPATQQGAGLIDVGAATESALQRRR